MDIDRIQQLASTAKVMRTGSEQQRRRRDQNPREFSDLLEENLDEEEVQAESKPQGTSQDVVSFSNAGKVSAETLRAAGNLARISMAQRQMLELFNPRFSEVADEPLAENSDKREDPSSINELA